VITSWASFGGEDDLQHNRESTDPADRPWIVWYSFLTLGLASGLLWAFLTVNNLYPIPVWSLFSEAVADEGATYWVLIGEEVGEEEVELPAIGLTDALTGRIHMMVSYVVGNRPFTVKDLHPQNRVLVDSAGAPERLPDAVRMSDLLRAWGTIHNQRHPADDPRRLGAIRLEERHWPGIASHDYAIPVRRWREVLP
jgi:hypothetical protein